MISEYFHQLLSNSDFENTHQILNLLLPLNQKFAQVFAKKRRRRRKVVASPEKPEKPKKSKFNIAGYYAELKAKAEEASAQVQKYAKEQALRDAHRQAQLAKVEQLAKEDAAEQARLQQEKTESLQQQRSAQLEQLRQKKANRLQASTVSKSFSKSRLAGKPLYKMLEERHQSYADLPALEQRKAELAQLRGFNAPLRREHLKEHIDWYNQRKLQHKPPELVKTAAPFSSSLGAKLIKEDRKWHKQEEVLKQELLERTAKRQQYAKTVKESFVPVVDPKKTEEVKARLQKKSKPKHFGSSESSVWKPKEYPRNNMVPAPPEKREPKVIDYLAELRAKGQDSPANTSAILNSDMPQKKKMKKLRVLEERLDLEMRKQDIQLEAGVPNAHILKERESTNDVLISSIKAKLGVLQGVLTPH